MGPRKKIRHNRESSGDDDASKSHHNDDGESEGCFYSSSSLTSSSASSQLEEDNEKLRAKVAYLEKQLQSNYQRSANGVDNILKKFGLEVANAQAHHLYLNDKFVRFPFEYFCIGQQSRTILESLPKFSGLTVLGKNFSASSTEFAQQPISLNIHIIWMTRYYYSVQAKEFTVVNHAKLQRTMVCLYKRLWQSPHTYFAGKISSDSQG